MKYPIHFELQLLPINELLVDDRYQRDIQSNSRYIGENFDPEAAGAIVIGVRKDREKNKYIVDGLQRTTGAKAAGYSEILCLVFESEGITHEAKVFGMLNGKHRKKVTPRETFKAALQAKEPTAIEINNICNNLGFELATSTYSYARWPLIQCIRTIEKIHDEGGLEEILELIKTIWEPDRDALKEEFIKGFWDFYKVAKEKPKFNRDYMISKFTDEQPILIIKDAYRESIEKSAAGFDRYKFITLQLLFIYNKRCKNKIIL